MVPNGRFVLWLTAGRCHVLTPKDLQQLLVADDATIKLNLCSSTNCGQVGTRSGFHWPWAGLLLSRGGEGGRGFWTQNLVSQKWPDQIFPIVNFVFSHYVTLVWGGGEGVLGNPPLVFNYSKEALAVGDTRCGCGFITERLRPTTHRPVPTPQHSHLNLTP